MNIFWMHIPFIFFLKWAYIFLPSIGVDIIMRDNNRGKYTPRLKIKILLRENLLPAMLKTTIVAYALY